MAVNRLHPLGGLTSPQDVWKACALRSSNIPLSGDPVVYGKIPGVAVSDGDSGGKVVAYLEGIFNLAVTAAAGAIAVGDIVYFDVAQATNAAALNNTNTNVRFGYAMDAIGSGLSATIRVKVGY